MIATEKSKKQLVHSESEVAEIRGSRSLLSVRSFCSIARGQSCLGIIKGCARPLGRLLDLWSRGAREPPRRRVPHTFVTPLSRSTLESKAYSSSV